MDATIKDLKLDINARLNNDTKKQLEKILIDEFSSQRTKYQHEIEESKQKILDAYKKQIGFDKLTRRIQNAESELRNAKEALEATGLDSNGNVNHWEAKNVEAKELRLKINKLSEAYNPLNTLKNKFITRLYMSSTMGEAAVIMREVMGNGQLPSLSQEQIKGIEHK